jgi:hypothetical protein
MPIAEVQAELCVPREVDDLTRQLILSTLERSADTWRMACVVRSFAEHVAQQTIATLGDWAAVLFTAARGLNHPQRMIHGDATLWINERQHAGEQLRQAVNHGANWIVELDIEAPMIQRQQRR